MSRLSFRPRPLDIHKRLPIVRSFKEFEDDDVAPPIASTRNSHQLHRLVAEADNEVHQISSKRSSQEIPTPEFSIVETYERDYTCTFTHPTSYLRGRGARAEIGEFVEYDLDNEDEDWLEEFNKEQEILTPEMFENILFKLEVLDQKTRERAGVITPTFGSPIPVLLELDAAAEALQSQCAQFSVLQSVYDHWKEKREWWQKPILRHLQPPPPVNDTNPYNVFRPREKVHRLHTRRMQRRENNVQSFEKLRQVRRNLDQAKTVLKSLIKREEKKREVVESEVNLQRIQMKYKIEAQLIEDGMGLPPAFRKFRSGEDDFVDSDDSRPYSRPVAGRNNPFASGSRLIMVPNGRTKRVLKRRPPTNGWLHKQEPILLFARPPDPERLVAAGIAPPQDPPYRFHGRIGRGGRVLFDRWEPLLRSAPNPRPPLPDG